MTEALADGSLEHKLQDLCRLGSAIDCSIASANARHQLESLSYSDQSTEPGLPDAAQRPILVWTEKFAIVVHHFWTASKPLSGTASGYWIRADQRDMEHISHAHHAVGEVSSHGDPAVVQVEDLAHLRLQLGVARSIVSAASQHLQAIEVVLLGSASALEVRSLTEHLLRTPRRPRDEEGVLDLEHVCASAPVLLQLHSQRAMLRPCTTNAPGIFLSAHSTSALIPGKEFSCDWPRSRRGRTVVCEFGRRASFSHKGVRVAPQRVVAVAPVTHSFEGHDDSGGIGFVGGSGELRNVALSNQQHYDFPHSTLALRMNVGESHQPTPRTADRCDSRRRAQSLFRIPAQPFPSSRLMNIGAPRAEARGANTRDRRPSAVT
ncbi:hypothetical protein A1Q1_05182 [Trichosporon asahii var. asahii CBS 2479]|uniref:Uncharacterized protein n=1 Tax=Trichosporon asahii var. asahii (strain ATCC 90039 / CBS 2479 / JCM 2466 / KCTC 7840 / NBRC 103889/ NCYC 2677 / UAMH 7654) TaxID=1186058 RepID=J4U7E8_TRIAS|nr:hypothetical protein A1Q1_05182 [Trichosporon asahii var. asahii CBS 2479]EJT46225.1 hypothetical protein A1Q1_05182 [Trichosporon asahii var. asahii CBS 2479]